MQKSDDLKNDERENRKAEFLKTKTGSADNRNIAKQKAAHGRKAIISKTKRKTAEQAEMRSHWQKRMIFENYKDRQHWRDKCGFWKTKRISAH